MMILNLNHFTCVSQCVQCSILPLSANRITVLSTWSKIEETVRFCTAKSQLHHEEVIQEQVHSCEQATSDKKYSDQKCW